MYFDQLPQNVFHNIHRMFVLSSFGLGGGSWLGCGYCWSWGGSIQQGLGCWPTMGFVSVYKHAVSAGILRWFFIFVMVMNYFGRIIHAGDGTTEPIFPSIFFSGKGNETSTRRCRNQDGLSSSSFGVSEWWLAQYWYRGVSPQGIITYWVLN